MPKKKTDEILEALPEDFLTVEQDTSQRESAELPASSEAEMDLNEILETIDSPEPGNTALLIEDESFETEEISEAEDDGEMPEVTLQDDDSDDLATPEQPTENPKTKRTTRKRKVAEPDEDKGSPGDERQEPIATTQRPSTRRPEKNAPILTIEARGEVETQESIEDTIWHEIHNAYRTRRMLTGVLGGIEQTENGKTIVVVEYKGFRIIIPLKEMTVSPSGTLSGNAYTDYVTRQHKVLSNMLGAEIDFVVKGIDSKTRSVVASRKEAMLKKRQLFYLNTDAAGMYRIYEGRIVQSRVIAVAEKVIRIEAFGVECSIMARDLSWEWIGDARDRFSVGDQVLVRITSVRRSSLDSLAITADIRSISENTDQDNLKKCRIQSKYAGKVTDVHKGVVYIRLTNGVNAIAHSCYDRRMPGKKDDVSFAVTRIDEERGIALGIITRIIKQNL